MSETDPYSERPPPRPPLPKRQKEPRVISGGIADLKASEAFASARGPFAAGLAGAALGGALALIGAWALAPRLAPLSARLDALEAARDAETQIGERRDAALAERANAETKLAARIGALEQARAAPAAEPKAEAAARDLAALRDEFARQAAAAPAAEARLAAQDLDKRVAALEAAGLRSDALAPLAAEIRGLGAAVASLRDDLASARQAAAEAKEEGQGLDKRLSALEGASLRADALRPVADEARAARDAADRAFAAAGAADPGLARLAAAEAAAAKRFDAAVDALAARLDRLEAAAAAPKMTSRIAPDETPASPATARAVAALALREAMAAGRALGREIDVLARLGEGAAALAPLRVYEAAGAPTSAQLADEFVALAPLRATGEASGAAQRLLGEVQGLVKMRRIGDTRAPGGAGVERALRGGDFAAALAAFDASPEPGQAREWRERLAARAAAEAAAEALWARALAGLGGR